MDTRIPRTITVAATLGRVGFAAKALLYGGIGWLACTSAVSSPQNESPQGVFLLIGSHGDPFGVVLLFAVLLGLASYVCWRFTEGLTGQGSAPYLSPLANFFRYRLSPLVSGTVYLVYAAYVAFLLATPSGDVAAHGADGASCFPACWTESSAGSAGLALLVLAFAIGAITQLQPAITASFDQEMHRQRLARAPAPFARALRIAGRIGFFARAALFALVAVYFGRIVVGAELATDPRQSTVARALNELRTSGAGRSLLFAVGAGLVVYAAFAAASVRFRAFPTPTPRPRTANRSARG